MKTTHLKGLGILVLAASMGLSGIAFAATDSHVHNVTLSVPSQLFIASATNDYTLGFNSGHSNGSISDTLVVTYNVGSNTMSQADGAAAVSAQLDSVFADIDFQAQVGTYTKNSGNTELVAASGSYVTIGSTATTLMNKANSTGDGKVLDGSIPVTYRAVATSDLASGDRTQQLTVTLTDI